MQVLNGSLEDIDTIFTLYRKAIDYQKAHGYNEWKGFERDLIVTEINEKRLWKIIIDGQIACIFSVAYSDPVIWGENASLPSEGGWIEENQYSTETIPPSGGRGAIYLHRISTNPAFKGRNMMQVIIDWSKNHIKETGRKYIRMDTWADNKNLADYYVKCGFTIVGSRQLDKDTKGLPKHYSTLSLTLFEIGL